VASDTVNLMKSSKVVPNAPILIVRWIHGKLERDEIAAIRKHLGLRATIQGVRARYKEEVYESFAFWLKMPDARILYIGAHGSRRGLMDRRTRAPELMEWEQLGRRLESIPEAFNHPVQLVLGACYSSLAPSIWTKLELRVPVSRVFCVAEEPADEDVVALIVAMLKADRQQERLAMVEGEITYFDEDVRDLLGTLPHRLKVRLFLRGDRLNKYAFVELKDLDDQSKVKHSLEARRHRRKSSSLESAVRNGFASPVPSNSELEHLQAEAKRLNRIAIDDKDGVLPARPLPKQSTRHHPRGKKGPMSKT
jgi:hypothetical protein